jgi:glucose-1-phosphate adenylyltransferase
MNRVVALILAGGRGERLSILSEERAKPAVVFGGKYRIIDFTLSNCVHSGIQRVALLTQYRPRSLNAHIGIGKPWDLDRMGGGIVLLQPYEGRYSSDWYRGTADAVHQNLLYVEESKADQALILSGDHIYQMQYNEMIAFHRDKGADCTVGLVNVSLEEASRYGILEIDSQNAIVAFHEKPKEPRGTLASMGIYILEKDVLLEKLAEDAANPGSTHDFGRDIIPTMLGRYRVYGYRFDGYWRDVGTVRALWEANMDLLADLPGLNLYDESHPVLTRSQNRPPARSGPRAQIMRSIVSEGCIINGVVHNSVLSRGVYVEEGAVIEDSILFDDCHVQRAAHIHTSILDKEVIVGHEARIGWGYDLTPNDEEPDHLNTGITVVGSRARIPASARIGRNCKVYPGCDAEAFSDDTVPSGRTVRAPAYSRA